MYKIGTLSQNTSISSIVINGISHVLIVIIERITYGHLLPHCESSLYEKLYSPLLKDLYCPIRFNPFFFKYTRYIAPDYVTCRDYYIHFINQLWYLNMTNTCLFAESAGQIPDPESKQSREQSVLPENEGRLLPVFGWGGYWRDPKQ